MVNHVVYLRGDVVVTYQQMRLVADRATYDQVTGDLEASGHVVFDDPHGHLEAQRAHYNVLNGRGWFTEAHGYVRFAAPRKKAVSAFTNQAATTSTPLYVRAGKLERVNQNTYSIQNAHFSTCKNERNGLAFGLGRAQLEIGHSLKGRDAVFRFLGLPVLFLPFFSLSASRPARHSGFLLPEIGSNTQKGFMFGDGFYWALNPSADLLLGLEDFSLRGVGVSGRFRADPSATSTLTANFFAINDRASGALRSIRAPGGSFNIIGQAANLGDGFHGVVDVNYTNSLAFREMWSNTFNQAVFSEALQSGFATKNVGPYSINFYASRFQDFLSASPVSEPSVIITQAPSVSFSGLDNELGRSPFYFSFDTSIDGLARSEPGFTTPALTERLDAYPRLTLHLKPLWDFHLTPTFAIRDTYYGTSLKPGNGPINRTLGEISVNLSPPSFEKVFSHPFWGHRFKHVIVPDIKYHLVKATKPQNIFDIVRFDTTDVWTEDNELDYSLTNSLLERKLSKPGKPKPQARDLLDWTISQAYFFDPTFGGAVRSGSQVAIEPTLDLTGFSFPEGRRLSPIDSVLKFSPTSNLDAEFRTDIALQTVRAVVPDSASTRLSREVSETGLLDAGVTSGFHVHGLDAAFTDFFVNHTELLPAPIAPAFVPFALPTFNLLDFMGSYTNFFHKRLSAAFRVDYNLSQGIAEDYIDQISYNFGCFAFNLQVERFNLGFIRNENAISFSITLGRMGTFGSFKPGQFIQNQLGRMP